MLYDSSSKYAKEISAAADSWNKLGQLKISPSASGSAPTVTVNDVNDPSVSWRGQYVAPNSGQPAEITINMAYLQNAPAELIQSLIAHELGHALGLGDSASPGSLMNSLSSGPSPTALDSAALSQVDSSGAVCGQNLPPVQHDPFCENPNECDFITPMEVNMEACEKNWMKDGEFVGRWLTNPTIYLSCGDYFHIYRQRFQENVTLKDRRNFNGCVGMALAFGEPYVEANRAGRQWTNPDTGVTVKVPLDFNVKYSYWYVKSAYAGDDGKNWGGCVSQ
ncbi:MAG: M57 family metalloprotease [Mycobacterium sp.]